MTNHERWEKGVGVLGGNSSSLSGTPIFEEKRQRSCLIAPHLTKFTLFTKSYGGRQAAPQLTKLV